MSKPFIIVTHEQYENAKAKLALDFCPDIYPCMKCGMPVIDGYCCKHCGDYAPYEPSSED